MMLALACLFTPAFTTGAEPVAAVPLLPRQRDHGHPAAGRRRGGGRVAGGDHVVTDRDADRGRSARLTALNGGLSLAFLVAAVISIGAIVLAVFMRNPKPEPAEPEGSADDLDVEAGAADRAVQA